jgi:arsenate reductase (glutaredoxin)
MFRAAARRAAPPRLRRPPQPPPPPLRHACVLWHNPGCSKSRRALELLQQRGGEPLFSVREYLKEPPSLFELKALQRALQRLPNEWVRADADQAPTVYESDSAVLEAIVAEPELLERPIFVAGSKAVVGRPPECVIELMEEHAEEERKKRGVTDGETGSSDPLLVDLLN